MGAYDNTIADCLAARKKYQLCDWAYIEVLTAVSQKICPDANDAAFLASYMAAQSGYAMRMATKDNRLYMLIHSQYFLYNRTYVTIDGKLYYPLEKVEDGLNICPATFKGEKPLSLMIQKEQLFRNKPTAAINRKSNKYNLSVDVSVNQNSIDFYNNYPAGAINGQIGTRWTSYANTPLEKSVREAIYPVLKESVEGFSERDAVNKILRWVQSAFVYQFDDEVWGYDRAFFASETLFYPYADCEDRAILFARIVRDILGLKVALLYYPGHLAAAVCFTDPNITGDYLIVGARKYIVCDPTYINAPIGRTMPGMSNAKAQVIEL